MKSARLMVMIAVGVFAGCDRQPAPPSARAGAPDLMPPGDIVFSRNCGRPGGEGYVQLARRLELGSSVFALAPAKDWGDLRKALVPGEGANGLALLYADEREFPDGSPKLVIVELVARDTGDGNWRPGPVLWADVFVADRAATGESKLLWRGGHALGSLQGSRVLRGQDDPGHRGSFVVEIEENAGTPQAGRRTCRFQTEAGFTVGMTEKRGE